MKLSKTSSGRSYGIAALCFLLCLITVFSILIQTDNAYAEKRQGPCKYKGKLYFFNSDGKIAKSSKEKRRSYEGKYYYVLKDGRIRKGWNTIGKNLYYFGKKTGAMVVNKKVSGITLLPDGKAQKSYINSDGKKVTSLDVSIRIKCIKALKKRGAYNKSKSKQLRAAWTYLTDRKTFHYSKIYPNLKDKQWTKKYANRMLSSHGGNCYGYAAAFAYVAKGLGYSARVCTGTVASALGGRTDHAWTEVRIGKVWYIFDTEMQRAKGTGYYKQTYESYPAGPIEKKTSQSVSFD